MMQVLQLAPSRGGHGCCTELTDFKQEGINHVEGGWPKDIDVKEQDQVRMSRVKQLTIMTELCVADGEVHQEDREGREVHQQLSGDRAGGGAQGQAEQLRGHLQGLLPIHRRGGNTRAANEHSQSFTILPEVFLILPQATYEHSAELRIVADYADPAPSGRGRPVSAVSWSPDGGTSIAVAYCSPEFLGPQGVL